MFVFTITRLTTLLVRDLSPAAVLEMVLVFGNVWWMYGGYAWLTNAVPPRDPFAFTWLGALLGVAFRKPEMVQATGFVAIFPLTFASSAFVPVSTMPGWLQAFARHTPMTATVEVCGLAANLLYGRLAR